MNVDATIVPGVYYDMPNSLYRAAPGVSQSELKRIQRSPAHFKAGVDADEDKEDTSAMLIGRVAGALALEPEQEPFWIVKPEGLNLSTKEGRAWKAQKDLDKDVLSHEEFRTASCCATAVLDHAESREFLEGAKREVSIFTTLQTEHGPVLAKGRPDIMPMESNCVLDIKTCLDCRPENFLKSITKLRYDIQLASYMHIWNQEQPHSHREIGLLIAVEKIPPYAVMVHRLSAEFLQYGLNDYLDMLNLYAKCAKEQNWPGYPGGIFTIELPDYLKPKIAY